MTVVKTASLKRTTCDGTAIATVYPEKLRYDVVAATGQAGFERSGSDVTVRTTSGQRVEVHAQAADGTLVKLGGTGSQHIEV